MERLSRCEEEILLTIYQMKTEAEVRGILTKVNELFGHAWKTQTVSTFATRCRTKGYLAMERRGRFCYYHPVMELRKYQLQRMREIASEVFGEDLEQMQRCMDLISK